MDVSKDVAAPVEAAVKDYVEGWYNGEAPRMERALHPDLVKRILEHGEDGQPVFRRVSKERMVSLTEGGGGGSPGAEYEIEVHHVSGDIASARVHSLEYLDYLHLVKSENGWQIADILFRTWE